MDSLMAKRLLLIPFAINILIAGAFFFAVLSLFPIFPSRSGYTMTAEIRINQNSRVRVLVEADLIGVELPEDMSSMFHEIEMTFGMHFQADFNIFICRDKQANIRLCPFFVTPATGIAVGGCFVIINMESMTEHGYTLATAISHETTHTLFSQNMDLWNSALLAYSHGWIREGAAIFMQQKYETGTEGTWSRGAENIFLDKEFNIQTVPQNRRLEYRIGGAFCGFLRDTYGAAAFMQYCNRVIRDINADAAIFQDIFGKDLAGEFGGFVERLK
jgi:hypothetical protein